jgi:hypothetical protein
MSSLRSPINNYNNDAGNTNSINLYTWQNYVEFLDLEFHQSPVKFCLWPTNLEI